jgi:hypothetical protein
METWSPTMRLLVTDRGDFGSGVPVQQNMSLYAVSLETIARACERMTEKPS